MNEQQQTTTPRFTCQRCQRSFVSEQGLKMHDRTVHDPNRPKSKVSEELLDQRRRAQYLRAEKNRALGLTAKGTKPKRRRGRRRAYVRNHAEPVAHKFHANFCPNCGHDLR